MVVKCSGKAKTTPTGPSPPKVAALPRIFVPRRRQTNVRRGACVEPTEDAEHQQEVVRIERSGTGSREELLRNVGNGMNEKDFKGMGFHGSKYQTLDSKF